MQIELLYSFSVEEYNLLQSLWKVGAVLKMDFKQLGNKSVQVPAVGIGTWEMGGGLSPDTSGDIGCVRALRKAIELGMTLIDTAEKYADGHAEELVGEAIQPFPREQLFIVSKVWPDHLQYDEVIKAAERMFV